MSDEPSIEPASTGDATTDDGSNPSVVEDTTPKGDADTSTEGDDMTTDGSENTSPESYSDFKLPEGVELDKALLDKATPIFKKFNLTQEQAQEFVDFQAEMVQEGQRMQSEAFDKLIEGWQKESENDKEFGGDKFKENVGIARLAIDKFGTPELKELMEDHGIGNHPEMIRFMWNVGKLLKEDVPGGITGAPSEKKDRVSTLYPNDRKS